MEVTSEQATTVDADWPGEVVPLERADSVSVLTACDNAVDIFLVDAGRLEAVPAGP